LVKLPMLEADETNGYEEWMEEEGEIVWGKEIR
jgi:hypothetical protein